MCVFASTFFSCFHHFIFYSNSVFFRIFFFKCTSMSKAFFFLQTGFFFRLKSHTFFIVALLILFVCWCVFLVGSYRLCARCLPKCTEIKRRREKISARYGMNFAQPTRNELWCSSETTHVFCTGKTKTNKQNVILK